MSNHFWNIGTVFWQSKYYTFSRFSTAKPLPVDPLWQLQTRQVDHSLYETISIMSKYDAKHFTMTSYIHFQPFLKLWLRFGKFETFHFFGIWSAKPCRFQWTLCGTSQHGRSTTHGTKRILIMIKYGSKHIQMTSHLHDWTFLRLR